MGQLGELLWLGKEHSDLGITRYSMVQYCSVGGSGCMGGCLLNYVPTSCVTVYRNAGIDYSDPEYWTQGFRYTCKADGSLAIPNFLQAVAEPVSGAPAVDLHQCVQGDLLCIQTTPVHVSVQMMSAGKSLALVHSVSAVSVVNALLSACTVHSEFLKGLLTVPFQGTAKQCKTAAVRTTVLVTGSSHM